MLKDYNKLVNSKEFKNWKDKHKDAYLSSCVLINDSGAKGNWSFDFYIPRKNRITTFIVDKYIIMSEDQKIFEQTKKKLKEVNINEIKFDLDNVHKFIDKKYKIKPMKIIIVLQYLNKLTWNISLLGTDFNLVNMKLDAKTGKLLDKTTTSMLQFKAS